MQNRLFSVKLKSYGEEKRGCGRAWKTLGKRPDGETYGGTAERHCKESGESWGQGEEEESLIIS